MQGKKDKIITSFMMKYELLQVIGNPYVHIFGVGLPIMFAIIITKVALAEVPGEEWAPMVTTSIYLGMGALIPMAVLLMGYSVSYAQELSKGIPERMQLFGIKKSVQLCNRALSQLLFLLFAFLIFFTSGYLLSELQRPTMHGLAVYILCMLAFSMICLALAHGLACICRNFGKTYCVSMILYFAFMILGGMMGISYEDLPAWAQAVAKLLPVTYINKDFYKIWTGESYHYMPMLQSFLFLGAVSGILLFFALKRHPGIHRQRA
ncbi:MAG: ABC transporter permease [Eubacterium sp.]|nr:ABC transporter permease [Eubacterium sp.]